MPFWLELDERNCGFKDNQKLGVDCFLVFTVCHWRCGTRALDRRQQWHHKAHCGRETSYWGCYDWSTCGRRAHAPFSRCFRSARTARPRSARWQISSSQSQALANLTAKGAGGVFYRLFCVPAATANQEARGVKGKVHAVRIWTKWKRRMGVFK